MKQAKKRSKYICILCIAAVVLFSTAFAFSGCNYFVKYSVRVENGTFTNTEYTLKTFEKGFSASVYSEVPYGSKFDGWYCGGNFVSLNNPYIFAVSQDIVLTAKVTLAERRNVKITNGYLNGNMSLTNADFFQGETIKITPSVPSGMQFDYWLINGVNVSNNVSYSFRLEEDSVIQPKFINLFVINLSGGKFNDGINADKSNGTFKRNEKVVVKAIVPVGYKFEKWTDKNGETVSLTPDFTLTVVGDQDYTMHYVRI